MLSFHPSLKDKSWPIATGYNTKDCVGRPIFKVYYIENFDNETPPEILSNDAKGLLATDRYRIMREYSLSNSEYKLLVDRVAADEPVIETSSRTLKRCYLEIKRIMSEKLKTTLEFSNSDKVYLKPIFDTTQDRTNQIISLFDSNGCGKSWMVNDLLMRNPAVKNHVPPAIYLFSSVGDDDPSYRPLKEFYNEKFVWVDPRDVGPDDVNIKSYKPKTILIFDDINSLSDKRVKSMIVRFRDRCCEICRHDSLVVVSTEHLYHNRAHTQKLRNSSAYMVLYPRNSPKPIDDLLENQMNYGRFQRTDLIKKLKREGRAQFIRADMPTYLVNTKRVQLF